MIINHDGNCTWLCPVTLLSQCRINVRQFPFDRTGNFSFLSQNNEFLNGFPKSRDFGCPHCRDVHI